MVNFTGGDKVTDKNQSYAFTIVLHCDKNGTKNLTMTSTTREDTPDKITFVVDATTKEACPVFSISELMTFINNNQLIFVAIFGVLGIFETFLGKKMFKPTLFISGFIVTFIIVLALIFALFVKNDTPDWAKWAILVASILLGLTIGYLSIKLEKTGIFLIGAWLGAVLGALVY